MSEGLFTPLFLTAVVALLWDKEGSVWRLRLAGLLFGLAAVTHYSAGPVLPVFLLVALFGTVKGRRETRFRQLSLTRASIVLVAVLVVLVPFQALHFLNTGNVSGTNFTFNLCLGNSPGASGHQPLAPGPCDPGQGRSWRTTTGWIVTHLGDEPRLVAVRASDLMGSDTYLLDDYPKAGWRHLPLTARAAHDLSRGWWIAISVLALLGLITGMTYCLPPFRWAILLAGCLLIGPLITIGNPRFHDPLRPFMAICVGVLPFAAHQLVRSGIERVR